MTDWPGKLALYATAFMMWLCAVVATGWLALDLYGWLKGTL